MTSLDAGLEGGKLLRPELGGDDRGNPGVLWVPNKMLKIPTKKQEIK